jgi:hypothetical protein
MALYRFFLFLVVVVTKVIKKVYCSCRTGKFRNVTTEDLQ